MLSYRHNGEKRKVNIDKEELTKVLENHRHWLNQLTMHRDGGDICSECVHTEGSDEE